MPVLYIFSGLPGVGKSTLAHMLAKHYSATYLRIDTIEQALTELCKITIHAEGYELAHRIAEDNLGAGISVIADSCNTLDITRKAWENIALQTGASYVNIEVICSRADLHRQRLEARSPVPSWDNVQKREYHVWNKERIIIDTACRTPIECFNELLKSLLSQLEINAFSCPVCASPLATSQLIR